MISSVRHMAGWLCAGILGAVHSAGPPRPGAVVENAGRLQQQQRGGAQVCGGSVAHLIRRQAAAPVCMCELAPRPAVLPSSFKVASYTGRQGTQSQKPIPGDTAHGTGALPHNQLTRVCSNHCLPPISQTNAAPGWQPLRQRPPQGLPSGGPPASPRRPRWQP